MSDDEEDNVDNEIQNPLQFSSSTSNMKQVVSNQEEGDNEETGDEEEGDIEDIEDVSGDDGEAGGVDFEDSLFEDNGEEEEDEEENERTRGERSHHSSAADDEDENQDGHSQEEEAEEERELSHRSASEEAGSVQGDGSDEDYSDVDDEGEEGYRVGGYHRVNLNEIYGEKYRIRKKLGWGHFSTVWMVDNMKQLIPKDKPQNPKLLALKVKGQTHTNISDENREY